MASGETKPSVIKLAEAGDREGINAIAGGSAFDVWNGVILSQVAKTAFYPSNVSDDDRDAISASCAAAMVGMAPKSELESMAAAQLFAAHSAAMDCYRRAMINGQSGEFREACLSQANKLSRTFATLLEALDKHRARGRAQKIKVEHVHVYPGGQAIVGDVTGGGAAPKIEEQPYAKRLANAPLPQVSGADPLGNVVPIARDA